MFSTNSYSEVSSNAFQTNSNKSLTKPSQSKPKQTNPIEAFQLMQSDPKFQIKSKDSSVKANRKSP